MQKSSNRIKLTDPFIRSLANVEERVEYSDMQQIGLRLRASPGSQVRFAYKGRHPDGRTRTVTIGDYPAISLKQARDRAAEIRQEMKGGADPTQDKRRQRQVTTTTDITLGALLDEYEAFAAPNRKIWQKSKKGRAEARRRIECVFDAVMDKPAKDLTLTELSRIMRDHKPRASHTKAKANGQVSRARAYLAPVFDWAAGRKRFSKVGAGRDEIIDVPDLGLTHDPASDDPTITGKSERLLDQDQLARVLPLLRYPAPSCLKMQLAPEQDYRPIALRFLLLTAARLDEVASMRWGDVNLTLGIWHKPSVKSTRGKPRDQHLPLSDEARRLVEFLPTCGVAQPNDLVFPNEAGGKLGNWPRITRAIIRESGSMVWHRHDLRRTASTLMQALGVAGSVIDTILAHTKPRQEENTSAALSHYAIVGKRILRNAPDPQKIALDMLAEALAQIELDGLEPQREKNAYGHGHAVLPRGHAKQANWTPVC